MVNSRLKDDLDLVVIAERETLDGSTLALAIAATLQRRGTRVPAELLTDLSDEFARDRLADLERRGESLALGMSQQRALLRQLTSERQSIDWTPGATHCASPSRTATTGQRRSSSPKVRTGSSTGPIFLR